MNAQQTLMPIDDAQKLGVLQEVNRRFLHPLGLSLEAAGESIVIIDQRDSPEGIIIDVGELDTDAACALEREWAAREPARRKALGFMVQPRR